LRPGLECGAPDETVEARASGLGIERTAALALDDPAAWGVAADDAVQLRRHWLDDGRSITVPNLAAAAAAGQPLAQRILDRATTVLGWALAQATTLMSPECIVVGGGVSLIGPSYLAAVERAWRTYVFPPLREACRIVPAALGEDVVLYGAILLACGDGPAT
jgi:glucokinase